MEITWYGHAAFRLDGRGIDSRPVRVVLDPYRAPDVGTYAPVNDTADIVAVSHENQKYHSYVAGIGGDPEVVDGLALLDASQPQVVRGVPFTATRVWENDERREPIAMVGVEMDGIRVLHMGDCGHALAAEEVVACGQVDILLALAGGSPTLALPDLVRFMGDLKPRVVIPMHFGNEKINLNLCPIGDLLALLPTSTTVQNFDTSVVSVTLDTLPPPSSTPEFWILPPAR